MGINASYYGNRRPTKGEKPLSEEVLQIDQKGTPLPFGRKNPVDAFTGKHLFRLEKPEDATTEKPTTGGLVYLRSDTSHIAELGKPYKIGTLEGDVSGAKLSRSPVFSISELIDGGDFVVSVGTGKYYDKSSKGSITPAVASGMAPAMVLIVDESHQFAGIVNGVLTSSESGRASIIWKSPGIGELWCLISIPAEATITPPGPNLVLGSDGDSKLYWYDTFTVTDVW
jgi:hypothetical protein